jgi:hypothetical protein
MTATSIRPRATLRRAGGVLAVVVPVVQDVGQAVTGAPRAVDDLFDQEGNPIASRTASFSIGAPGLGYTDTNVRLERRVAKVVHGFEIRGRTKVRALARVGPFVPAELAPRPARRPGLRPRAIAAPRHVDAPDVRECPRAASASGAHRRCATHLPDAPGHRATSRRSVQPRAAASC